MKKCNKMWKTQHHGRVDREIKAIVVKLHAIRKVRTECI